MSSSSSSPLAILPLQSSKPGPYTPLTEGDGDVVYTHRLNKGKGRAVDYDDSSYPEHDYGQQGQGVYPPVNDDEAEEKKIQETLALYASREMAVRRAKRESKMVVRQSVASGSALGNGNNGAGEGMRKRSSWWGMVGLGGQPKDRDQVRSHLSRSKLIKKLPFHSYTPTQNQRLSPTHSRTSSSAETHPYPTPYDPPVNPYQPSISRSSSNVAGNGTKGRARTDSNATITAATAGAGAGVNVSPFGDEHAQSSSPIQARAFSYDQSQPPLATGPVPVLQPADGIIRQEQVNQRPEKWWHALCAWGEDLDQGGRDGQAGRTNPFE